MNEHDRLNSILRSSVRGSYWAIAPFCLGLVVALLVVFAQFVRELVDIVVGFSAMGGSDVILAVLKLVDLVFIANLVILIISARLELFMPRGPDTEHGTLDFAILKVRVFASISAIAAIDLLESFVDIDRADKTGVLWQTVILLAFVVSGVLLAWLDRLSAARH